MSKIIAMMATIATVTVGGVSLATHLAAQEPAQEASEARPTSVDADILNAAKNRMSVPGLASKMEAARERGQTLEGDMRAKAAMMAADNTKANVDELRRRFSGNAQVAEKEKKPCDTPPPNPPQDGSALCVPGAHEN